ncbi:DUF5017 domain-containing protein [Jilunia laotingensis]|jgi:hypothetical protein|nr:DUF5017 domain-containing protein [Jilunia laotingensis]
MKVAIKLLLGVCISLILSSCEEDTAPVPQAAMTVNKGQLEINESMIIHFTGSADQVVVYTGDDMHDYELREQSNTGFVVNKNLFTYSYATPGTYKVVCVASTYTDGATDLKRDTCSYTVTVIDDQTEIENISCPQIVYDEVFAEKLLNDEWLMRLPRKIKYNNQTASISLSQRLRFYIQSELTKVYINDKEFSSTAKYDLSAPVEVSVTSDYGTTRLHKLYTVNYPEFKSFTLAGATGTLIRNEFDYSTFVLEVVLPQGTDVSNLIPEFTTYSPDEKVYIGNVEQLSGTSAVDFTQEVHYRLVSTASGHPDMQAVSDVTVIITYQ